MQHILGIDGGGSRTRAVVLDESGSLLGYAMGDSINIDDYGVATATRNLEMLIEKLPMRHPFSAAFLSLGGVLSHKDRHAVRAICETFNLAPPERTEVNHDAVGGLAGGLEGEPGIVVVAGTGSICYGRDAGGTEARAGNWGPLFGDEGSGHWLGKEAMRAVALAHDGRGEATALTDAVTDWLFLSEMDEMLHRLYVDGLSRSEIAAFAPTVLDVAERGDNVATSILVSGCNLLATCVVKVHETLFKNSNVPTALIGGLSQNEAYLEAFREAVRKAEPRTTVRLPSLSPVMGSGLLALELTGVNITSDVKANLRKGYIQLPASFY